MSQAQSTLEDLQNRKAIADAEEAAIDAELARDESKKKLADVQPPVDPAKKAQDTAQKAQADAEAAAVKPRIGEIPSSGFSGSVKVEEGAASFETAILAARATVTASREIAKAVAAVASGSPSSVGRAAKKILVFAAGEMPDFQAPGRPTVI